MDYRKVFGENIKIQLISLVDDRAIDPNDCYLDKEKKSIVMG